MIDINKFEKLADEIISNVKKDGMKEQDLVDLGFERTDVSEIESGGDPFHYYTLDFTTGFSLITQASNEVVENEWFVEIFNTEDAIRFVDKNELEQFINIINKAQTNK